MLLDHVQQTGPRHSTGRVWSISTTKRITTRLNWHVIIWELSLLPSETSYKSSTLRDFSPMLVRQNVLFTELLWHIWNPVVCEQNIIKNRCKLIGLLATFNQAAVPKTFEDLPLSLIQRRFTTNFCDRMSQHLQYILSNTVFSERLGNEKAWIGAHRNFGDWQYDGLVKGKMAVNDWEKGQPDYESERCVTTRHWGRWNNIHCDWDFHYICEKWKQ